MQAPCLAVRNACSVIKRVKGNDLCASVDKERRDAFLTPWFIYTPRYKFAQFKLSDIWTRLFFLRENYILYLYFTVFQNEFLSTDFLAWFFIIRFWRGREEGRRCLCIGSYPQYDAQLAGCPIWHAFEYKTDNLSLWILWFVKRPKSSLESYFAANDTGGVGETVLRRLQRPQSEEK